MGFWHAHKEAQADLMSASMKGRALRFQILPGFHGRQQVSAGNDPWIRIVG
jgi:hypothetical protein